MANQPCPRIAQVQIQMYSDAQLIQNDFYFEHPSTNWAPGDMALLALTAGAEWADTLMPLYPDTVSLVSVVATDLTDLTKERAVYILPSPIAGSNATGALPANVALAVELFTGTRGRGQNGRVFFGPIARDNVTEDSIHGAAGVEIVSSIQGFIDAIHSMTMAPIPVVLSRYLAGVKRADGIGRPISAVRLSNPYLDSQRDRLPFHRKKRRTRV